MDTLSISEKNILMNEVENDGRAVHLYYSLSFGKYVAYGISAYIVVRVVRQVKSRYDNDLQMPMVEVNDSQVDTLRKWLTDIMYFEEEYVRLEALQGYDEQGYDEWAGYLREQYTGEK